MLPPKPAAPENTSEQNVDKNDKLPTPTTAADANSWLRAVVAPAAATTAPPPITPNALTKKTSNKLHDRSLMNEYLQDSYFYTARMQV